MSELEKLYDQQVGKVYKFFYTQSLNRQTSEDLTSQTFIAFIEKFQSQTIDQPKKYLYGIMRLVWIKFLRQKYQANLVDIENIADFEDFSNTTIAEFEGKSIKERAMQYIEKLPLKQQRVAKMRLIEEKSVKQVAVELQKSRFYVKTTQNRALKSLRKMLNSPYLEGVV